MVGNISSGVIYVPYNEQQTLLGGRDILEGNTSLKAVKKIGK